MQDQLTLNWKRSNRARDIGMEQSTCANASLLEDAIERLPGMHVRGETATGEQIRFWLTANGLKHPPTHQNFWGAFIAVAVKRGLLRDTGRSVRASSVKAHARRIVVWEFM